MNPVRGPASNGVNADFGSPFTVHRSLVTGHWFLIAGEPDNERAMNFAQR
jgi:hypothetical protein